MAMMIEALLSEAIPDGRTRCHVCARACLISPGGCGACGTRRNEGGQLYSLIMDRVSAICLDPIEKKPLYHFFPGSRVLSLGSVGCSFRCPGCQNAHLSAQSPPAADSALRVLSAEQAVARAVREGADGICWTYNEPAIWVEYTLAGARLAKEQGLYTAYVTNGTATREHLDLIGPYLDAYRVDLKAFSAAAYQQIAGFAGVEAIRDGVRYARERWGMHIECVTNVTPTINDRDEELQAIASWIASALGVDTPWHVTRFFPHAGLRHLPPTPLERLEYAEASGRAIGLRYIYLGNVPEIAQDTRCPECSGLLIRRSGYAVVENRIDEGKCPGCQVPIAGRYDQRRRPSRGTADRYEKW